MVDYTKDPGTSRGIGIYLAAGLVVLVLLYALFAGGASPVGETGIVAPEASETAPVAEESPAIIID